MSLSELSGCELVALASALAIVISEDLNANETAVLGDFFSALGQNLSVIANSKDT